MGAEPPARLLVSLAPDGGLQDGLLEVACDAARTAGVLLAERARRGVERDIASKSTPTDLVSEADLASERAIRELLGERRPNDGFIGEEGGPAEQGTSGLSWVVDPLDGTINFLFGIPQWCVSVAVRDREGTVAGAVYDPNRDELFTATRVRGPTLATPERVVELGSASGAPGASGRLSEAGRPVEDALAAAMVATGLGYDANVRRAQARVLERLVPRVRDIRRFGSAALDLTWTAAGRYDAYFERSVKEWDIAAGALICERAGLQVLELPVHEDLPWGILVAPPALAQPLLELVGGP
jgi:myo-inositol-1(or 4)-monophosphatase